MTDFVLLPNKASEIIGEILREVHGFRDSPEYSTLGDSGRDIPGVVCAALGHYVERLFRTEEGSSDSVDARYSALEMLERMAHEAALRELLTDEVFETWDLSPALDRIRASLGPEASVVFNSWSMTSSSDATLPPKPS
jgi:hypothetical protein